MSAKICLQGRKYMVICSSEGAATASGQSDLLEFIKYQKQVRKQEGQCMEKRRERMPEER